MYDVLGSATAGIVARVFTHPLDTVKARVQAPNASYRGPLDVILRTYRHEGLRAFYGGFGAVLIGGTPGTVIYLTSYAAIRDSISSAISGGSGGRVSAGGRDGASPLSHGQEFAIHFSSGMLAETITCVVYVPVDVVKERMQVQQRMDNGSHNYKYSGSFDALRKIMRTEGMRGIYKGYGATLASFGPFSAFYFMFYEQCKSWSKEYLNGGDGAGHGKIREDGELPLAHLIAGSAGAGALASFLTSPLDMAKLRLQVQRGQATAGEQTTRYRGMFDCLNIAYNKGGVRGLFKGAGARVMHFVPATTITMTCYEKFRSFYASSLS